jgi:flagella basal body P-ring formation protein FlgA
MPRLLLFFVIFLAHAPLMAAITLREEAVVSEAFIRLGDIAATGTQELRELRIGYSPRAGNALVLKRADVQRIVARLKPELRVRVEGPERVTVRRGPLEQLELRLVRQSAERALKQGLTERYPRFEVHSSEPEEKTIAVPAGAVEIKSRAPLRIPSTGRVTVWTDVLINGGHYQSIPLSFTVRAYQPALVARRALRAGEALVAADFEVRETHVEGIAADTDLKSLRLRQPLGAGSVLAAQHVAQARGVTRHQPVVVRVAFGSVALETTALASGDGKLGEVIRVRNPETNQTYPARVAGPGVVEALWR